jgi:maltose O-acetyltransferase
MDRIENQESTQKVAYHENIRLSDKLGMVLREEMGAIQPLVLFANLITCLIPRYVGSRLRRRVLNLFGISIGRGTIVMGTPHMYGSGNIRGRLHIGEYAVINVDCFFDLNAPIKIGSHAALGHEVMIMTSSHLIGSADHRAGPLYTSPVIIRDGAWIGARSIILPGVTVGEGSIVGAGAIVTKDVPPSTLVGGVPARVIRTVN